MPSLMPYMPLGTTNFIASQSKGRAPTHGNTGGDPKGLAAHPLVCRHGSASQKVWSIRICVDLKPLNESVLREVHPIPKVVLAQLTGAKLFSKLDANSGFWPIPLAEASQLLTTFVTPYGRYCFNKLPFGISSAPELYQKGLLGVLCLIDHVIVFGGDQVEHDARLLTTLRRIEEANVTLNNYGEMCIQKDITEVPRSHDRPGRHQS